MAKKNSKGLVQVYKGRGKGKTTAALGLAFRSVGQGFKVLVVQFMKPTDFITGEINAAKRLSPELRIVQFGDSKMWGLGVPKKKHGHKESEAALEALGFAKKELRAGWDMIILDEIGMALHLGLLDKQEVINTLKEKPPHLELVLTGLKMPDKIVELADLVSEIKDIKHPYNKGIRARKGIEF